jgi:hypothetical protein
METEDFVLRRWIKDVFFKANTEDILDTRGTEAKNKLFAQKERDWLKFGYTQAYLDSMKKMAFWDNEYGKIHHYDDLIVQARTKR